MNNKDKELLDSAIKLLKKAKKKKEKKIPKSFKLCYSTFQELEKIAIEKEINYDQLFKLLINQYKNGKIS